MSDIEDKSPDAGDRSRSRDRQESDTRTRAGHGRGRDRLRTPRPFMSPKRAQPPPVDAANWNPYGSFGAPESAPTAETPPSGTAGGAMGEDVGIEDEDMDDSGWVLNAPALPQPPNFKGSTKAERRVFMREYQKYALQVDALRSAGQRPFLMPVSACIDHFTKRRVAVFDFEKDIQQITEEDWVKWFKEAYEETPVELDVMKKRLQAAIVFDLSITDADSRVSRMLDNLMKALEADGQEWVLHQEAKIVVGLISKAIQPVALQKAVAKQMELSRNKPLKADVVRFVKWLRQYATGYQLYGGMDNDKPGKPAAEEMKRGASRGGKVRGKEKASGAGEERVEGAKKPAGDAKKAAMTCLKCGSNDHLVRDHPGISETEAKQLIADWHQNRRKAVNAMRAVDKESEAVTSVKYGATVEGVLALSTVLLDSGSDESLATLGLLKALRNLGVEPEFLSKTACDLKPYGAESKPLRVYRQVRFKTLELNTSFGPLMLRGLTAWVDEGTADCDLLIGRPAMERLGFSVDGLLVEALKQQPVWDMDDAAEPIAAMARVNRLRQLKLEQEPDGDDDDAEACATPELGRVTRVDEVQEVLEQKVAEAMEQGLPPGQVDELRRILRAYQDVFRLDFGKDPPVKVAPLKVRLKEGAVPVKVGLRRYPPAHMEYLRQHVAELEAAGLIYRNNRATWAAAPRIVPKKNPGEYRMTIDSRPINAWTEAMPWPMPNLEAAMATLVGMEVFFTLDWLKGYWQLPLHPECQMWYSFMTPFGVYTPTRILMGQTDAVAFCQSVVNELFGDLMYQGVLGWLDDLLGYARSADQLLVLLEKVLHTCQEYRLKLHPKKCDFYLKEAKWCGKVISSEGISHDPSRVQGLCEMKAPTTAAELQQFLCATNWMRASIPVYAQRVDPLRRLLDVATKIAGSAKKTALAKVDLAVAGWTAEHDECFEEVKATLARMVPLAHPSEDKAICLFTDASADHWGAACTQVPNEDLELTVDKQRHEPLAFLSGSFTGASSRWPVIEKEAYAVVESCKRLEYLLLRQQGFRLFTDHRNLLYIFNPRGYDSGMARYQAHKLQRWAMVMATFPYTLEHVAGEANVWGDLLSRWGAAQQRRPVLRVRQLAIVVSPLQKSDFEWPTADKIAMIQRDALRDETTNGMDAQWDEESGMFKLPDGKIWVPDAAVDLQQRLCVVAHQGAAGHRGIDVTTQGVMDLFTWKSAKQDIEDFVKGCIHCLCIDGVVVPRPWGSALHAEKPNELIHFDWLQLPEAKNGWKYVLVVKDDMSGFCRLYPSPSADAEKTAEALMDWFTTYGNVTTWVSDGGSHFKNEVVAKIQKLIGAHHHITTPHSPWANGTVEVVNRLILRCMKALLSEMRLKVDEWFRVLPLVQGALNHQPADRLGGIAPITAFTGLPAKPPLTGLVHPKTKKVHNIDWLDDKRKQNLAELRHAIEVLHREVAEKSEKRRKQARDARERKRNVKVAKFAPGDFVLVGKIVKHPNKLALNWRGPFRVVRMLADYLTEVEQLVEPFATSVHHACRLKLYCEGGLDLTEDLVEYIAFGDEGFYVEDILKIRRELDGSFMALVKWMGLAEEEASWEPALQLMEDIPIIMKRWMRSHRDEDLVAEMQSILDPKLGGAP